MWPVMFSFSLWDYPLYINQMTCKPMTLASDVFKHFSLIVVLFGYGSFSGFVPLIHITTLFASTLPHYLLLCRIQKWKAFALYVTCIFISGEKESPSLFVADFKGSGQTKDRGETQQWEVCTVSYENQMLICFTMSYTIAFSYGPAVKQ